MIDKAMLRDEIDAWFDRHSDRLVSDVCKLIAVRSVREEALPGKPYGAGPAAALEAASAILESNGLKPENHENHVVTADLNDKEPALGILAHVDTVSEGGGWTSDPLTAVVRDGMLFGRGAIDDKGPAVAAIYALSAVKSLAPELKKGCRLILGSAEETGHEDLMHYRKTHRLPPNVFTPDSNYPVVNLEKGRFVPTFGAEWQESRALPRVVSVRGGAATNVVPNLAEALVEGFSLAYIQDLCNEFSAKLGVKMSAESLYDVIKISAGGVAAHAMKPEEGVNAQTALIALLASLPLHESDGFRYLKALNMLFPHGDTSGEALGVSMRDDISGALTLNFGVLSLDLTGFTANFDCRSPKCATEENLFNVASAALKNAGFTISDVKKIPCHHTPEDSAFVQTLLKTYEEYTGKKGACLAFGGQTYVHDIDGGVAFGPAMQGVDNRLHGADEFISIEELILSAKMYTQVIIEMCS